VDLEGCYFGASEHWRCPKAHLVAVSDSLCFVFA
jgi:hypothetical protein